MKKKVIISACILGEYCRYDGKTKKIDAVLEKYKGYEIIPFCPEAPLFGTPRQRIDVVKIDKDNRIITQNTQEDVTEMLEKEIESFCKDNTQIDAIVLKSKSPSCGNGTTPILDKEGKIIEYGDGIAAKIFKKCYKNVTIKDENSKY